MYAERVKSKGRSLPESTRMMLEVYIPTFSVTALLAVTGWITSDAIAVIQSGGDGEDVDVYFLYGFACGNMVVDAISSYMFYARSDDVLLSRRSFAFSTDGLDEERAKGTKNLNMISALTHVGGDTLRTLSVFIAAVIATTSSVNSALCDAWASVVVSFTICCAVIPLILEIRNAAFRR
jgi:Co/Zn/Cd efflux system component